MATRSMTSNNHMLVTMGCSDVIMKSLYDVFVSLLILIVERYVILSAINTINIRISVRCLEGYD